MQRHQEVCLYPLGGCHGLFFNRLKLSCGSETIEDIQDYARVHDMFHISNASDSRADDYAEGFCNYWDDMNTKSSEITKTNRILGIRSTRYMTVFIQTIKRLFKAEKLYSPPICTFKDRIAINWKI